MDSQSEVLRSINPLSLLPSEGRTKACLADFQLLVPGFGLYLYQGVDFFCTWVRILLCTGVRMLLKRSRIYYVLVFVGGTPENSETSGQRYICQQSVDNVS